MNQDEEHLQLLSIFYFVCAGLAAFGICLGALYFVIGIVLLVSREAMGPPGENPEGFIAIPLTIVGGFLSLLAAAFATCLVVAGRSLTRKKHHTFCLVISGIACMFFPFGTTLGVFGLIVLSRPTVKALFDRATPPVYAS